MTAGKLKVILVLVMVLLSISLVACGKRTAPLVNYENQAIVTTSDKPKTLEDISKAITIAAVSKNWILSDAGPGHATAKLVVRGKHTVVVDITYTETVLSIKYKDSTNMNYDADRNNNEYIHPKYNIWVSDLMKAISKELVR